MQLWIKNIQTKLLKCKVPTRKNIFELDSEGKIFFPSPTNVWKILKNLIFLSNTFSLNKLKTNNVKQLTKMPVSYQEIGVIQMINLKFSAIFTTLRKEISRNFAKSSC